MLSSYHFVRHIIVMKFRKCILVVFAISITINFFLMHGRFNYSHVPEDAIDRVLYKSVIPTILIEDKPDCTYHHVLRNTHTVQTWDVVKNYHEFDPKGIVNGSFSPEQCNPLFSVAILVTYRNRKYQLDIFLPYMHNFLRKQNIHYKIYVIEQGDEKPFNKGLLYNLGAHRAIADRFPCLILHDVDLLPLDASNLYACTSDPRHLSASIDKFRFVLIYDWLVGGVLSIRSDQYVQLNGFSNRFLNWGSEDDDFYMRLKEQNMEVIRFPRWMSRYTMLRHAPAPANPWRDAQLHANRRDTNAARQEDGFRTAHAFVHVVNRRLCTLLAVQT